MNVADAHFKDLPPALQAYIRELEDKAAASVRYQEQIAVLQQRVDTLEEQFRLAQLKRFAPSSEKYGLQGCLFNEAEREDAAQAAETPAQTDSSQEPAARHKKPGRKPLPAHLPRQRIEHDLPESDKVCGCCHGALHRIGEETTEQLDIVPAKVVVLEHVRFKYGCRQCERHGETSKIVTSPMPTQPIPGSIASPSTLATVMTAKYADGMPLYRQQAALERSDVPVVRGTLGNWCIKGGKLLSPLYAALHNVLLSHPIIHGDETTVQVLKESGRNAQSTSYMWVYRTAEGSEQPVVLFEYQAGRGHVHPKRFLNGYRGTVMTDGYAAWRMLEGVTHLGCMAHARRRFDEALKAQKNPTGRAKEGLDFIRKLYRIEAQARGKPPEGMTVAEHTHRLRQEKSRPILDAFHAWLVEHNAAVLPKTLIGDAIRYALKQWQYLVRYIDDGRAPIDNNLIERDIRPFTTGRNAWLFSDSVAGADASAIIYSLMLTCRACGVEPYAYLRHVFTALPQRQPGCDLTDLLPFNYAKATTTGK
jgi:transposase